jgi:hypothetical protein
LTPAANAAREERWHLELGKDGVRLLDDNGEVAMRLGRDEANSRIMFPSFFLSMNCLQFMNGLAAKYRFRRDKEALTRIRSYLDKALREDPRARRKFKQRGLTMVFLGVLASSIGGAGFAWLWATGTLDHWRYKSSALSITGFLLGFVLMGHGIGMYFKAARMAKN